MKLLLFHEFHWISMKKKGPLSEMNVLKLCISTRTEFMRPGHHWICVFGDTGNDTSYEK
jgi:hypothetical protein